MLWFYTDKTFTGAVRKVSFVTHLLVMYVKDLRLPQLLSIQLHFPQMTSNPRNRFQRYISFARKDILISPDHFLSFCGRKWDYIWFDKVTENKWIDPTKLSSNLKGFVKIFCKINFSLFWDVRNALVRVWNHIQFSENTGIQ